ncbi:MAG: sterol desaturase family protein [Sphingomonas sp.]|nr:sterol desaturase family protein [Sphingomonas sp.]
MALHLEPLLRLAAFAMVFAGLAILEPMLPRRIQVIGRQQRWPSNFGLVAVDTALVRIVFPTATIGLAVVAAGHGWGLLNQVAMPGWVGGIVAFVLLDLVIYGQHRLFHAVPLLWRLHRVHHADLELDVTTGIRFHPGEILLSMLIKFAAVLVIGAPALAVLIFEVVLNASSMFNHANIKLPVRFDAMLRRLVVTPDMHRVHHSIVRRETDSNFGFNLSTWDRWLGTYRAQPEAGHERMTIGLAQFRGPAELRLDRLLLQPLRTERDARETRT